MFTNLFLTSTISWPYSQSHQIYTVSLHICKPFWWCSCCMMVWYLTLVTQFLAYLPLIKVLATLMQLGLSGFVLLYFINSIVAELVMGTSIFLNVSFLGDSHQRFKSHSPKYEMETLPKLKINLVLLKVSREK